MDLSKAVAGTCLLIIVLLSAGHALSQDKPPAAVDVPRGAWHRIENPGRRPVVIIEVQLGPYLGEDDIVRRHDDYGRAGRR